MTNKPDRTWFEWVMRGADRTGGRIATGLGLILLGLGITWLGSFTAWPWLSKAGIIILVVGLILFGT